MEIRTDPPQRLFIQRGGTPGRLADPFVQAEVLIEPPQQLGLLSTDRVAPTLDNTG